MTTVAVKERPILFSGAMVRAILDGRKTQTRRVMKPQPPKGELGDYEYGDTPPTCEWYEQTIVGKDGEERPGPTIFGAYYDEWGIKCPYGGPGDRLWVRETFDWVAGTESVSAAGSGTITGSRRFEHKRYKADGCQAVTGKWTPSIHMPRWMSRITLEITEVRVEQLQSITTGGYKFKSDVQKEGCPFENDPSAYGADEALWFAELWDSINLKRGYGWDANPWVWVIEFKR